MYFLERDRQEKFLASGELDHCLGPASLPGTRAPATASWRLCYMRGYYCCDRMGELNACGMLI